MATTEVTSGVIKDASITAAKMAVNSVDSASYVDGSIDPEHLADNAVTLAKMASGTDGNIISFDSSGNPVAIATGSATQVLTSAGAGQPPAFADAGGGGFTHIQTIVASSTATIDFDSKLTTDFDGYLLTGFGVNGATDHAQPWLRVSTDGGSNWKYGASDYGWVYLGTLSGGGSTVVGYDFADVAFGLHAQPAETGLRSSSSHNSQFQCYISHPMTAAFHTTFHSTLCNGHGSEPGLSHNAGSRTTAEQNNSVQFLMESGAVATGTFTLFGVNKS